MFSLPLLGVTMEIWRIVGGFPLYEVSNLGNVRSNQYESARALRPNLKRNGYVQVCLSNDAGRKYVLVHRLVAKAFLAPAPRRPWVNHKDGNKQHNLDTNLEWSTPRQNNAHANARGVRNAMTNPKRAHKLTAEIVAEIRATVPKGRGAKAAAERFGISATLLQRILRNTMWRMP
jgi:hypothetical protein